MREGTITGARALYEESLALRREIGDKWGIGSSLHNLAFIAWGRGDYQGARALFEESLALRREIGDKYAISITLSQLGDMIQEQGDYTGARALHEECLALRREIGNKVGIAESNFSLRMWNGSRGTTQGHGLCSRKAGPGTGDWA